MSLFGLISLGSRMFYLSYAFVPGTSVLRPVRCDRYRFISLISHHAPSRQLTLFVFCRLRNGKKKTAYGRNILAVYLCYGRPIFCINRCQCHRLLLSSSPAMQLLLLQSRKTWSWPWPSTPPFRRLSQKESLHCQMSSRFPNFPAPAAGEALATRPTTAGAPRMRLHRPPPRWPTGGRPSQQMRNMVAGLRLPLRPSATSQLGHKSTSIVLRRLWPHRLKKLLLSLSPRLPRWARRPSTKATCSTHQSTPALSI